MVSPLQLPLGLGPRLVQNEKSRKHTLKYFFKVFVCLFSANWLWDQAELHLQETFSPNLEKPNYRAKERGKGRERCTGGGNEN